MDEDTELARRFPLLFAVDRWVWIPADMRFSTALPPDAQVTSIHLVGFADDRVVLCRDDRPGVWFLPGGTREPGEAIEDAVRREVLEESGARVVGPVHLLGAHTGRSEADGPYRPHLPYPHAAWLWLWAEVVVDGIPTNPADGEQVEEVRLVPLDEARELLRNDMVWGGDLVELAAERRAQRSVRSAPRSGGAS